LLKKIIKKILNSEQRDWLRYRTVKISYYINNFFKTFSLKFPFDKKKINYKKLNNIIKKNLNIVFFYYYYNKFFGSYKNINYFRNLCLKILSTTENNTLLYSKINSCLELSLFEKVRDILKRENKVSHRYKNKVNIILKIISNQNPSKEVFISNLKNKEDIKYFNLINQKRIALVGPCNNKNKHGQEIDKFDLVVRTNFTDVIKLDKDRTGLRTDITYYNDMYWIDHKVRILELNNNIWKNFKSQNFYKKYKKESKNSINSRTFERLDFLSNLRSGCYSIANILFDLLLLNPKIIKIFNCDFYNNGSGYFPTYQFLRKEKIHIDNILGKEIRHHDPFFSFNLIKILTNSKKVVLDKSLKKYIAYSNYKYEKNLDKYFGKFTY
jgi:hypothetical protein